MKNSRHLHVRVAQGALVVAILAGVPIVALETATHVLVNQEAVESWTYAEDGVTRNRLDQILRDVLGYREGRQTRLAGRLVQPWIDMGGVLEDQGSVTGSGRFYRHFHDPLAPSWDRAGLTFPGPNESSVRWMQNRDQDGTGAAGGNWSWPDARRMYYQALTESDHGRRNALLAATFRALGQIMHLVVDASVPEHARDDAHPRGTALFFWSYDTWVQSRHGDAGSSGAFVQRFLSNPIGFDAALLTEQGPDPDEAATVPVARLIDSNLYKFPSPGPSVTVNPGNPQAAVKIGIAEIASANFFSEDRFGLGPSPYPPSPLFREPGLIPVAAPRGTFTPDGLNIVRRYWRRPAGQGLLPVNPLRADCVSRFLGPLSGLAASSPCVDGAVWDAVAAHMLPRAVGYARGVLDYFFRSGLRVVEVVPKSTGIVITIENNSEEPMNGVFEIFARHQKGTPEEQRQRVAVLNEGKPFELDAYDTVELPLELAPGTPTAYHVLVFRGRLGLEEDAVVGQVFAVPYVNIVQESYDADLTKTCTTTTLRLSDRSSESLVCTWKPINHRIQGRLVTNFAGGDPTDPTNLAIDRIEALWIGTAGGALFGVRGPAPLTLDGTDYPSGVWTRGEDDPDPSSFLIVDPEAPDSRLILIVYPRGDYSERSIQLATFAETTAVSHKTAGVQNSIWGVNAGRQWRVNLNMRNPYRAASVGGIPVPTLRKTEREFLRVNSLGGEYAITDVSETFDSRAAAEAFMAEIELEVRFPEPPDLHWSAVVRPLPPHPVVLQHFNAFAASGDPPLVSFTMTGREAEGP